MTDLSNAEYTLYSAPFSLYSMMARHTIQLGRLTPDARPPRSITLSFVDHRNHENLKEDYLLNVNPKGQIPALTGNVLEQPITDSGSISLYLAEKHYPALLPAEYEDVIRDLIKRIHDVPGPAFGNNLRTMKMVEHSPSPVEDILKRTDLSPEYRTALEAKLEFHNNNYGKALQPAIVAKAGTDLQAIFAEILEHRRQSGASDDETEWTFGAQVGPTVLDSHLLPIVLRCIDADNTELVPLELQRWAVAKSKSPAWAKVMRGRSTKWDPSMGPIADMQEMMSL